MVAAEEELGINALGLKGLLKPILSLHKKRDEPTVPSVVLRQRDPYKPPDVFETERYFKSIVNEHTVEVSAQSE